MMQRQLLHMTRLVDDLLDVPRITHGHIELRKEPVELNSKKLPGSLKAAGPADVKPADFDLVALAYQGNLVAILGCMGVHHQPVLS